MSEACLVAIAAATPIRTSRARFVTRSQLVNHLPVLAIISIMRCPEHTRPSNKCAQILALVIFLAAGACSQSD